MGEGRQDATGQPSTERVSVPQAADHLGTTVDAIRKRVQRGTIPHEKDGDGRVWILLDTGRPRQDKDQDTTGQRYDTRDVAPLVDEMRGRIESLERQLEQANERDRENRRIIAALTQRIPAIDAPQEAPGQEPPESPTEATKQPGRVEPQPSVEGTTDEQQGRGPIPDTPGPERGAERPWWQRWFGSVDR